MKLYRCLVWVGIILLSIVCLVSCNGETHTYARDAWFSESVLNDCALLTMPTPAEGISYVKEDENSIYLNLSRKEYIAYIESLYEAVLAEDFTFMGAVKDAETNIFGKTTYRTRMAKLFYEFFIGESGENEEFCILFGNEEPQNGRVSGTRVHVWWSESVVAPIGDDNFPYNTKITICRTADQPREQYTIAQYKIAYEAAPDGTSTLTGKSVAYEGQNVEVAGTYEGETWHRNLYLNQQKLGCSYQGSSRGDHHSIRLWTDFAMPGEDITISWTGGNEEFIGGITTFDRVAPWINGLEADNVAYIGSSNSHLASGQPFPVARVTKVEDKDVIARILEAWKKSIVTCSYDGHGLLAGGTSSYIGFALTDGTSQGIQVSDKELISRDWMGHGLYLKVEKFHSYTEEEMEKYCCFDPNNWFGYSEDAITLEVLEDGEWVAKKTLTETEDIDAAIMAIRMQQTSIAEEMRTEPLYRIDNQTGFYIYVYGDSLIGVERFSQYYQFYEIESGSMSALYDFLMGQPD